MTKISTTCLDPYVESFLEGFAASDYAAGTIKRFRQQAQKLGHLMEAAGVTPSALTPALAEELVRAAMAEKERNRGLLKTARRFAGHLIDLGVVLPPPPTEAQIARTALLADYEAYVAKQRGLSPRSVQRARDFAERFLDHRFGSNRIDPGALGAADVTRFLQALLSGERRYRHKTAPSHLRSFLQYLFARGRTSRDLSLHVPKTAQRWGARLPRHLSPEGVEAVLAHVRDHPRCGARDYAMLLLMARLGLRAMEVVAIQLEDIDWHVGELTVRGKGKFHDRVPITAEVGEALSRYLRDERGRTQCRSVFVTHRAPHRAFRNSEMINIILREALAATGQKPSVPYVGSHLLRHSLATGLVNAGASLEEVGDVLRHRSRASTMIYARLDIDGLRSVARPWPEAEGAE